MEANDTWLTPTLTVLLGELQPRRFEDDSRMRWIPGSVRERWDARPRMPEAQEAEIGQRMLANAQRAVAIAHGAGVGVLAGTDASDMPYIFAGSSLHDELSMYVEAGLTRRGRFEVHKRLMLIASLNLMLPAYTRLGFALGWPIWTGIVATILTWIILPIAYDLLTRRAIHWASIAGIVFSIATFALMFAIVFSPLMGVIESRFFL